MGVHVKIATDTTEESLSRMSAAMSCFRCGSKESSRLVVKLACNRGTYQFSYFWTWRFSVPLGSSSWLLTSPASSQHRAWIIKCWAFFGTGVQNVVTFERQSHPIVCTFHFS